MTQETCDRATFLRFIEQSIVLDCHLARFVPQELNSSATASIFNELGRGVILTYVQALVELNVIKPDELESKILNDCNLQIEQLSVENGSHAEQLRWLRDSAIPTWFEFLREEILKTKIELFPTLIEIPK